MHNDILGIGSGELLL